MAIPESRRLDFTEIPVIDLGTYMQTSHDPQMIDEMRRACADVGFFYVTNHGIAPATISALHSAAEEFFKRPMQDKMQCALNDRMQGYLPLYYRSYEGEERAATSHQEGFWIGHERALDPARPLDGPNLWPADSDQLKASMLDYFSEIDVLRQYLQRAFAQALGIDEQQFDALFDRAVSRLKLNHYPPQHDEITENNLGVVPHCDSGGFTILWQDDNGGLEVQSKNGDWVGAPPINGTFVVNLGQIMQIWSNGRFSATPHRVINRNGANRYSIPLFVNPDTSAIIEPLVGNTEGFKGFMYGDYQRRSWQKAFPVANIP